MKKTIRSFIALTAVFVLTACSSTDSKDNMYIEKAELSEEEQSILEFAGSENVPYILHFAVDDTVQSLQINTYELQDKEWKLMYGGGGLEFSEPSGRIALTFDNIGFGMRAAVENRGANSYTVDSDFNFEGMGATTSYLTDKTDIVYEQEIPLVIQIHTSKNEVSAYFPQSGFYEPETFSDLGYEKVYAITCLFSQKSVGEQSVLADRS